ncbi:hypothetical protein [Fulvivirga ligni]|uniref:hypothetical protein n=1 Tax=Fulvivirga ligni TaxID=2904246 RepID=UPI001F4300FF|nr:hypothetical protein [Fulvivirga ligni]UII20499.1 hypothetical protein LVD16_21915 [Fulvivirga ligni]
METTENKEIKNDQLWLTLFTVIPVVSASNLGRELSLLLGINSILVSAIVGGVGGAIGFGLYQFTKESSMIAGVLTLLALFISIIMLIIIIDSPREDKAIINEEWESQQIGTLIFISTDRLELQTNTS